jgi:hypothetical protein
LLTQASTNPEHFNAFDPASLWQSRDFGDSICSRHAFEFKQRRGSNETGLSWLPKLHALDLLRRAEVPQLRRLCVARDVLWRPFQVVLHQDPPRHEFLQVAVLS